MDVVDAADCAGLLTGAGPRDDRLWHRVRGINVKISYLVPEFPGQTHIFFWREMRQLERMGVEPFVVSTRRPATEIISHDWSAAAMRTTVYLWPPSLPRFLRGLWRVIAAGPGRWWACFCAGWACRPRTFGRLVKLCGLMLLGGQMSGEARRNGWQHLHVQSCADSLYIALFAHLLDDLSYSLTLHGPLKYFGPGQPEKWRHARFAIAVTEKLRQEIAESLPFYPQERVSVAPMGADLSIFSRTKPYTPATGDGAARIVTCGRLDFRKGHQDLIRAVCSAQSEGLRVALTILGEGPARADLEALIASLGAESSVTLRGAVSEGEVRAELESSHLFSLASHEEAIGVATMEAMGMGLPVVVTGVGGVAELVRDGVDGLLVPPQDPDALCRALVRLLRDPDLCQRMGTAGAQRVHESFGSDRSARIMARELGCG